MIWLSWLLVCAVLRGFVVVAGWLLLLMWVGLIVLVIMPQFSIDIRGW